MVLIFYSRAASWRRNITFSRRRSSEEVADAGRCRVSGTAAKSGGSNGCAVIVVGASRNGDAEPATGAGTCGGGRGVGVADSGCCNMPCGVAGAGGYSHALTLASEVDSCCRLSCCSSRSNRSVASVGCNGVGEGDRCPGVR